jgi:dTDP-glucose pyrophosphorylase
LKSWLKTIISSNKTIKDVINVLENSGQGIALVVGDKEHFEGTVTDGDVRRGLINGMSMKSMVSEIMNRQPITSKNSDSRDEMLLKMRKEKVLHMPIIDGDGLLCGLETLHRLISKPSFDNPVFILAGGLGSRLYPLTENTPKPLLNVGSQPILETIIDQFISAGFHNFFISVNYKSEMIQNYFGDGSKWGINIQYVCEDKPLGTAGAIGLLPKNLPELPIIVMNGDLLTKVDFQLLLNFHNEQTGAATMCVREYDYKVPYGVVNVEKSLIKNIEEKPVHKFYVNAGIYVLNNSLIRKFNGSTFLNMTDFLSKELHEERVNAFPIYEYWLDIGHKDQFDKANRDVIELFKD